MDTSKAIKLFHQGLPIFSMLQDENRQKILMMLYCNDELTVTQITEKLKLSRPAVSHHLKLLLDSGLVTVNQVGKERYYKIHLTDLINLMRNLADTLDKKQ